LRLVISGFILELSVEQILECGKDLEPSRSQTRGDSKYWGPFPQDMCGIGTDFILQATSLRHGWHA
jgi:hypothetical protein